MHATNEDIHDGGFSPPAAQEGRTLVVGILQSIVREAEALGLSRARLCSALGEGALTLMTADATARVPVPVARRLMEVVSAYTPDPRLPIDIGKRLRCPELGLLGFMFLTAESGSHILDLINLTDLASQEGTWRVVESTDGIHIVVDHVSGDFGAGHQWIEATLTSVVAMLTDCVGSFAPSRVCFRHRAPPTVVAHREHFGCPVEFGADRHEIVLDTDFRVLRPRLSQAEMFSYFERTARLELATLEHEVAFPDRVRRCLLVELENGSTTSHRIAHRLGLGERTLRRKLEECGLTFQTLRDDVRRERAQQLLEDGERSITDVALAVGFSEASAFSRAFRRLTGASPRQYRHATARAVRPRQSSR